MAQRMSKHTLDFLFNCVSIVLIRLLGFFIPTLIVSYLGVRDFGAYTIALTMSQLLAAISSCGMSQAIVSYYPDYEKDNRLFSLLLQSLSPIVFVSLPISVIFFFLADQLSLLLLHSEEYTLLFKINSILLIVIAIYNIVINFIRGRDEIKLYSSIETLLVWLEIPLGLLILLFYRSLEALVSMLIGVYVLVAGGIVIHLLQIMPWRRPGWTGWWRLYAFGLPLVPSRLSNEVSNRGDRLIVGYFLGAAAAGTYSFYYMLANVISYLSLPFISVMPSKLIRLWYSNEKDKIYQIIYLSLKWILLLSLLLIIFMDSMGGYIFKFIIKKDQLEFSRMTLLILMGGILLFSLGRLCNLIQLVNRRTGAMGLIWTATALINIVANFILVPIIGIDGAAIATLLSYLVMCIISYKLISNLLADIINLKIVGKLIFLFLVGLLLIFIDFSFVSQNLILIFLIKLMLFCSAVLVVNPMHIDAEYKARDKIMGYFRKIAGAEYGSS
jgi:O-antigen/teichoic acid export membrane protein